MSDTNQFNITSQDTIKVAVLETKFSSMENKLDQHITQYGFSTQKILDQLNNISNKLTSVIGDMGHDHVSVIDLEKNIHANNIKLEKIEEQLLIAKTTISNFQTVTTFCGITSLTGLVGAIYWLSTHIKL